MTSPVLISETQANLADNESSTAQTVREMGGHIQAACLDPLLSITAGECAGASARESASAIWDYCKRNIQFVQDEEQLERLLGRRDELELLISPSVLLRARSRQGDCDDFTMLACALLACCGITPLIKTFKCDADDPERWSHVCAAAVLEDGSIFPVDASHGAYAGWEVPREHVYQSQLWDMNGNRVGGGMGKVSRRGLGGYVLEKGWTGNAMTDWGPVAGPYAGGDVMRAWYPYTDRAAGLQGIAAGKYRGMGALTCVSYDADGNCTAFEGSDYTPPGATPTLDQMLQNDTGAGGGSAVNWNQLIAQLTGAGVRLGGQALATPGTTILPNGTIIAGTPQGTSALGSSTGISTGLLIALALGVGLIFALKK